MYNITNPDINKASDGKSIEYSEDYRNIGFFEQDDLKPDSHDKSYFESLLHQHDSYMGLKAHETEEMIRENEMNFVQGYQSPQGPFKYMSEEAKEKVHVELDRRLQEIEESGLTKEEILHEHLAPGGLKLLDDPFF